MDPIALPPSLISRREIEDAFARVMHCMSRMHEEIHIAQTGQTGGLMTRLDHVRTELDDLHKILFGQ